MTRGLSWDAIRVICIDLDGVVYHGDQVLPGAADAINNFRSRNKLIRFVTNNSAKTRASVANKLNAMAIGADENSVVTSGWAAGHYLKTRGFQQVLVIGTNDLREEISHFNIEVTDRFSADLPVLMGFNPDFSLRELNQAIEALKFGGELIACNRERTFPSQSGKLSAGLGPFVAAVEYGANVKATHIAGKPDKWMLKAVQNSTGVEPAQMLMIGDSLESDIQMAKTFGSHHIWISAPSQSSENFQVEFRTQNLAEVLQIFE